MAGVTPVTLVTLRPICRVTYMYKKKERRRDNPLHKGASVTSVTSVTSPSSSGGRSPRIAGANPVGEIVAILAHGYLRLLAQRDTPDDKPVDVPSHPSVHGLTIDTQRPVATRKEAPCR